MKKLLSFMLASVIASSSCCFAYASENIAEKIHFEELDNSAIEMAELLQKGDGKLCVVENSKSDFSIVVPNKAIKSLNDSVLALQEAIEKISGAKLPIVKASDADLSKPSIMIEVVNSKKDIDDATSQGFTIDVLDNGVVIFGFSEQGVRNGVYSFIEDKLGCMFLTPSDTYYPSAKSIYLETGNTSQKPATLWRDVYAYETIQNGWAGKLKLNGINVDSNNEDGFSEELQYEGWGTWCHNCYDFLDPAEYYDTHPEYFSEKNGKRVTTYADRGAYLCLSNPEVYDIVEKTLAKKIEENPDQLYWDFSGNDNPALAGCECEKCKALDEEAGGTGMGTLLPFLNKLAKAFPDKYISTLAYLHTLKAPKNIKAEPNVVIKLCSMPGDQASSYMKGKTNGSKQFKEQVEEWSKITDKIVVWDYVVNFSHLLMPFPNFAVQQENQRFYEKNGIIGVFHQASRETGGELANLRAYVLSQLMWHGSDFDIAGCVSKYVTAYFGNASPKVIEYLNLCADELVKSGKPLGLYDGLMPHYEGYLSPENVAKYNEILISAKELVKGDEQMEARLEEIELPITYANVLQPKISKAERSEELDRLNKLCKNREITMVCEWDSLENFNSSSLNGIVKGELKELNKPKIIAGSVAGGVAGVGIIATVIAKIVKSVKKKKKDKELK